MKRLIPCLAAVFATVLASAMPASAALNLCNRTSYVLYAATAVLDAKGILANGWTRIVPGACASAIEGDLTASATYVYARASAAHRGASRIWGGNTNFCARDTNFSLRLPALSGYCPTPDLTPLPFAAIATHNMRAWTTTFKETPNLASMKAAENAGLQRLLSDIGTRVGTAPKAMDAALDAFRRRAHLSGKASVNDLFAALEAEAMKAAAPAGYAICNDTKAPFWAALGRMSGAKWTAHGWWMVAPGSCANALSESVAHQKIYLRVENARGNALVSGPVQFCVANIQFDIEGRERCAARGLISAGFAQTNTDAPGLRAHVSAGGLARVPK